MASFRTGFKIFGELLLKEGLGRTRSFSEDRKPGQWLPEDQWAVRCPGSTCPPCDKPKKPAKPSKSWLSVCKDPEVPLECDVRHNNCPPPPVKEEGPWYSLDNLIPKKKQEKPPPICSCKEEMRRKEMMREEELEVKPSSHISRYSRSSRTAQQKKHEDNSNAVAVSHSRNQSESTGGSHILLGVKDPKDKALNEFEVLSKDKNSKSLLSSEELYKENENFSTSSIMLNNLDSKNLLKEVEPQLIKENETNLPLFENSEQNEDNPKAFMGSFGSWINDLFSGPNKRSNSSSKKYSKSHQQETSSEKDPEYFKSINALKKQFRKKLKSETSVHISGGDKLLEFDFNKFYSNENKLKRPKSTLNPMEYNKDFFDAYEKTDILPDYQDRAIKRQSGGIDYLPHEINHGDTLKETFQLKRSGELKSSIMVKEKKKTKRKSRAVREPEEYVFPQSQEFKKKLLLNINDQENCKQFYKNIPIEVQHYGQGKSKSHQSSTRCYTTNSNLGKTLGNSQSKTVISIDNKYMSSHTITNDEKKYALVKSSKKVRKTSGKIKVLSTGMLDMPRKSSSFVRVKPSKPAISIQTETAKIESKATSDELVKYLMKKVKVHPRPSSSKKKQQNLIPAVLPVNKTKFMQSATSSLVMSVLSKKEADAMPGKTSAIVPVSNKLVKTDLPTKCPFQPKNWNPKYSENIRHEVKRINFQNNLNKNSYLSDEILEMERENYVLDKTNIKNSKRLYANAKTEPKDTSDKSVKRDEVRSMLSNIEMRSNLYAHISRVKQNEIKKKSLKSSINTVDVIQAAPDSKENQSPRFQQQHELFKTSLKSHQQNLSSDLFQDCKNHEVDQNSSLSTQLVVVDDKFQLLPEEAKEIVKCDPQNSSEGSVSLNDKVEQSEMKVLDCLNIDDKEISLSADKKPTIDKPMMHKDKMLKNKALQYMKDGDKVFLGPLSDYCNEKQKDQYQPSICSSDLRPVKSIETVLLNRRFSTKTVGKKIRQKNRTPTSNLKALSLTSGQSGKPGQPGGGCQDTKKPEEKKDNCGPKPAEKKDTGIDCGPKPAEKKDTKIDCGPKPAEKKDNGIDCGPKPAEKKDKGTDCVPKSEEKKLNACKKEEKAKDCGFEKTQKPGPLCDGEKTKG